MIHSVTVINPKGESLVLELAKPDPAGLYVKSIDGLGPPKATINSRELATIDGGIFSSSRIEARNIVMTLGMLASPLIEDARLRTYKFFQIKKQVYLQIKTDRRTLETVGYVESNDPDIFSQDETTQISIICPDPFFYEEIDEEAIFSGVVNQFQFPFSNESLTQNLIEFGSIELDTSVNVKYTGDVDTGVTITIHALGAINDITIYNTETYESLSIDMARIATLSGKIFDTGDDIIISTVRGNRYVKLRRDGRDTNIISALSKDSDWFQLSNGDNLFSYTAGGQESNIVITFGYRNAYGGI